MPIGAENIGTAYVRVVADGKDFDLSDMFKGAEADAAKSGRRASNLYSEAFADEMKNTPDNKSIDNAIRKSLVKGDSAKNFTSSAEFIKFRKAITKEFGDVGKRAADNFQNELSNGKLDISGFVGRIENLNRDLLTAETQLNKERRQQAQNLANFGIALNAAIVQEERRKFNEMATVSKAYSLNFEFDRLRELKVQREGATQAAAIRENEQRDFARLMSNQRELATITRAYRLNDAFDAKQRLLDLDKLSAGHRRIHTEILKVADATGAAFGKGSRNNFLNFTGSVTRNVIALGASMFDLIGYAQNVRRTFQAAGGGIAGFGAALVSMRGLITAAVGGLAGLFLIIGPLTSILSGLGGMVLALASTMGGALLGGISQLSSTLVIGLAGALGIGATAFIPLIAGIGVFALAVANADDQTKKAFKSIGKEFSGLGEVAATSAFANIGEQATRFKAVIGDLSPLVRNIGTSISEIGDAWLDMLEGPGFGRFMEAFSDFLPGAVKDLGIALGDFVGGMGGLFRSLIPQTELFLTYIRGVAKDFNTFTNSANGQSTLTSFFERAAESAALLGGFLSAVRTLLAEVFDQANADGNGLFQSMTDSLLNWAEVLDANPDIMGGWSNSLGAFGGFAIAVKDLLIELLAAGDEVGNGLFASLATTIDGFVDKIRANPDIMKNFYDSAGAFSRALGEIVIGVGKVFSALDNTFSRAVLVGTFESLAGAIDLVAGALEGIASLFGNGANDVLTLTGKIGGATIAFGILSKALPVAALSGFVGNLKGAETRMGAMAGAAKGLAGAGGLLALTSAFSDTAREGASFVSVVKGAAGGAGVGFALGGPIGALIGAVGGGGLIALQGAFGDTALSAEQAADALKIKTGWANAKEGAESLAEALSTVVAGYGDVARATVEQSFFSDGKLDSDVALLRELGVSMDTIVSAALGRGDAINIVEAALRGQITTERELAAEALTAYETMAAAQRDQVLAGNDLSSQQVADLAALKAAYVAAGGDIDDLGQAFVDFNKRVSGNVEALRDQRQALQDMAGQLNISVEAFKKFPKDVRTKFVTEGLPETARDALRLIGDYKQLQTFKNIKAIITASGAELSFKQVKDLIGQYKLTPKQVKTLVSASGTDLTKGQLKDLIEKAKEFDRQKPRPKIDADSGPAKTKITALDTDLGNLNRKVTKPAIGVIDNASGTINNIIGGLAAIKPKFVTITTNYVRNGSPGMTATGGVFSGAQERIIGEAGPEAVVPLARNLAQVDPSVRWLSAIAQGKTPKMASGGIGGVPSKTISADGWTIVSQSSDTETVANEVLNRLVGAGY